ncbi:HBL/NHE enterotoxin family protein [Streptomyces telluris]|uniref:Alpha-helical pore-forming toxin family protein n=1 Tax=Streptomyces telluris TaxID=2720021 RepID=A0A9X2LMG8_9ACTN|nr:HBL/NHE enterotoxin family protein [Streptomyces telluris]MCQ8773557.1 alpha-helical pore-forming toxin family protein [Streptomyces telluris]NJP79056.1 alpha-helical pore-forming toxin family protein [Streptomyces telluris]
MTTAIQESITLQQQVGNAAVQQGGMTAIVQSYALSVTQQARLNLSGSDNSQVRAYAAGINTELGKAANTATTYLNNVQPQSMALLAETRAYFALQGAFVNILQLQQGLPPNQAAQLLSALRDEVGKIRDKAQQYATTMQNMRGSFEDSGREFASYAAKLHSVVGGDQGILKQLDDQLQQVNAQINANSHRAVNGLAILGGLALIAVGVLGAVFTGGLSLGLAIGGGALLVKGMGRTNGQALAQLYNQKSELLKKQQRIRDEVKLLQTCQAGLIDLGKQAGQAAAAAQNVANGWNSLKASLESVANFVGSGSQATGIVRQFYLDAALGRRDEILNKVTIMENNLTSTQVLTNPSTTTGSMIQAGLVQYA